MVLTHVAEMLEDLTYVDELIGERHRRPPLQGRWSATASSRASTTSTLDDDGRVADLTVFMRPMSALTAFNEQMAERLGVAPLPQPIRIAAAAGGVSEWLKETGCKPVGYAYAGSNPASPI